MGSKSGGKIKIYEHSMSIHAGLCSYTPGLELVAVKVGGKEMWRGSAVARAVHGIVNVDLFGGEKREGGVKGMMWWLPGADTQRLPAALWSRLGLTASTCPGFRGFASLFFTGTADSVSVPDTDPGEDATYAGKRAATRDNRASTGNMAGFYWSANNPYLRDIRPRVRRASIGLDPERALIRIQDDSKGNEQYASNPAHMIFECYTNNDFGLGEPTALMDEDAYIYAATVLYSEGFGLSVEWNRQGSVENFIGEILTHINAAVFVDPQTGRHSIKLLRGDYDPEFLPVIDSSNARLTNFKRKAWGEIVNEVVVEYTSAETGQPETVTAQDLAAFAAQGQPVPTSKNYYMITDRALAQRVAERDLAMAVAPLASCEAVVSRQFWATQTNTVFRLSWPEYGIENLVMRVVNFTKDSDTVTLQLTEDIFGVDRAEYVDTSDTGWSGSAGAPAPLTNYYVGTAPAFLAASEWGLNHPGQLQAPETMSLLLVAADSSDDVAYDLVTYVSDANGTVSQENVGTRSLVASWVTNAAIPAQSTTTITSFPGLRGPRPRRGDFLLFSGGSDGNSEIATVHTVDGDTFTLRRGLLDTVPRAWASGTRVFVMAAGDEAADAEVRADGEDVSYWLLTRTRGNALPLASAPEINVTLGNRAYRPLRPANVQVNGVGFGTVDGSALSSVTVTWANRNRTAESTQALHWTAGSVDPESGQTTRVDVLAGASGSTILASYHAITGTSYALDLTPFAGQGTVRVRVRAVRASVLSLQGHEIAISGLS